MTDKEFLKEFAGGVAIGIGVAGVFVMCAVLTGALIGEPEPIEKYKVVDHYGTCAVVRYNKQEEGRYTYFLDCGNEHLEEKGG